MNEQSISLDVSKQPAITPTVILGQGDKNGTVLTVTLYDNGVVMDIADYTVRLCIKLPDGNHYYSVGSGRRTPSQGLVSFYIDETYAAAYPGVTDNAYVEVLSGSYHIASTNRFRVVVLESAREGVSPGDAYSDDISEATEEARQAAAAANSAATSATNAASSATSAASTASAAAESASSAASAVADTYKGRSIADLFPVEVSAAGSVWQFLHNRIAAQDFSGLHVHDWFDVPFTSRSGTFTQASSRHEIKAFDHYYNCADNAIGHHIVCGPIEPINMAGSDYATNGSNIMWNTTATNQGTSSENNPYLNSNLHKWELQEYLTKLPASLQSLLLDHRSICEDRYSSSGNLNASTGWAWKSLGKVWSPSEMEVYGCRVWGTSGYSQGMDSQFPAYRETKDRIRGGRVDWWLRVVSGVSASNVCRVNRRGQADNLSATDTWGRPLPCFLLG